MNEMYAFSIGIHAWAVWLLIGTFLLNMALLAAAGEIRAYVKRMRTLMPVSASLLAVLIFTGAVMMAAKRLDFTLENVGMILLSIVLIILEAKRYKRLKRTDPGAEGGFGAYKAAAMKLMGTALGASGLMTWWMMAA